jgi:Mn2+/Fe2+ NRAMP family transporter
MCLRGGYKTLERAQITIVAVMLLTVLAAFFMMRPDWFQVLSGLFIPKSVSYPHWAISLEEIRTRPVWVETVTYVGIIGGSAYDYLAYVSYIREKGWIRSDGAWLRPILFDSVLSFVAVLLFTIVFTVCGALILQPQHQIPAGTDLLTLQSQFLTPLFPALKHLYFLGAFLAVFGTLYGTIEIAPAILHEMAEAFEIRCSPRIRFIAVGWVCALALVVLVVSLARKGDPPALIVILTPANLFTGVLACGCVCLLSVWTDLKFLKPELRMPLILTGLNVFGGLVFVLLGLKGYWDYSAAYSGIIFAGTLLAGLGAAILLRRKSQI